MPPGETVLALEEENAGNLQMDPHELRTSDEYGVKRRDGLVEQGFPRRWINGALGSLNSIHACLKQRSYAKFVLRRLLGWNLSGLDRLGGFDFIGLRRERQYEKQRSEDSTK